VSSVHNVLFGALIVVCHWGIVGIVRAVEFELGGMGSMQHSGFVTKAQCGSHLMI
jgi:hypothetical protein